MRSNAATNKKRHIASGILGPGDALSEVYLVAGFEKSLERAAVHENV